MNFEDYNFNWDTFLVPYKQAVAELSLKFQTLREQYLAGGEYSPIHYIYGRVKNVNSIIEKARKYGITIDEIDIKLKDIAGIRIVTQFEEDILFLEKLIKLRTDMRVVVIKDYLTNPKPSGYKSIHLIVEYDVNTINGVETVLCEIQLRTLAMDFWSTIEHSLNYKYKDAMPENIRQRLVMAAKGINDLDNEMGKIRDEITDAQRLFRHKSQVINSIIEDLNKLVKYGKKEMIKKYYKIFSEMRETDNTVQLTLLQKELEKELKDLSENIK